VSAVDLDGDGQDELLFYEASSGLFRYYDVSSEGRIGRPLLSGTYSVGWTSVSAVDLDGDGQDELLFYEASSGLFRYYDVFSEGRISAPLQGGSYSTGWTSVSAVDLDEVRCANEPFTSARVSALEARYPAQSFTAFVYDTRSGCVYRMNPGERLRTASVFKVMVMAGTLLEAQNDGRPLTAWERSQLGPMITVSANSPVRALWRSFGGSPWFTRQTQIFGLDQTNSVGDTQGVWGRSTTSAEDQVELIRQVLLGDWGPLREEYRDEAWDLMTSVVSSQTWGVTAGVPNGWTVAQKNGFAGHIANSVGFVQAPDSEEGYVIAILSNGWPSWQSGVPAVEEIARWVSGELTH
jgi:beta-lactamase class A